MFRYHSTRKWFINKSLLYIGFTSFAQYPSKTCPPVGGDLSIVIFTETDSEVNPALFVI